MTHEELLRLIAASFEERAGGDLVNTDLADMFYKPHPRLASMIESFLHRVDGNDVSSNDRQTLGAELEAIALVMFAGITGSSTVASYRGAMGQHDLVFRTSASIAGTLLRPYFFDQNFDVLLEAKATKAKADVAVVARHAFMLDAHFDRTVWLGVVLSVAGLSGHCHAYAVGDAHLVRLLFYKKHGKPIVCIDRANLEQLRDGENLLRILRMKVEELEELCRPPSDVDVAAHPRIRLPAHLQTVLDSLGAGAPQPLPHHEHDE